LANELNSLIKDETPALLSGEFFNDVAIRVADQATAIIMDIILFRILRNGVLPGEFELNDEIIRRLEDKQFDQLMATNDNIVQAELMQRSKHLDN